MSKFTHQTKTNPPSYKEKGSNHVRIIAGQWRRRQLAFPSALGLRPTGDRIRETLFNWLGQDLTGQTCLDLFTGSGALGIEAASRGASKVVLVERNPLVAQALQNNLHLLQGEQSSGAIQLYKQDAQSFLRGSLQKFDVIFVDPPFADNLWSSILSVLPEHLAEGGLVYVETPKGTPLPTGWQIHKQGKAGQITYYLLTHELN